MHIIAGRRSAATFFTHGRMASCRASSSGASHLCNRKSARFNIALSAKKLPSSRTASTWNGEGRQVLSLTRSSLVRSSGSNGGQAHLDLGHFLYLHRKCCLTSCPLLCPAWALVFRRFASHLRVNLVDLKPSACQVYGGVCFELGESRQETLEAYLQVIKHTLRRMDPRPRVQEAWLPRCATYTAPQTTFDLAIHGRWARRSNWEHLAGQYDCNHCRGDVEPVAHQTALIDSLLSALDLGAT